MARKADREGSNSGAGAAPPDFAARGSPGTLPPEMFSPMGLLALADLLPVLVAYLDRDLVYRFVNRPYAEWIERPRADILGRHVREVIGDERFRQREALLLRALGGERIFYASEFDHPTRGPLAIQSDFVPWTGLDENGEAQGVCVVVTDVTEQRAAERSLRESEARFRRIANSAPTMMWVTRLDRTREFVNDAYVDFVGGTREEASKLDWRLRIHPDDHDRIVAESLAGEAALQPFALEGRYLRHDGEYRWLRSVSQPRFGPDGDLNGFIGVASDISVAKQAELELKALVEERTAKLAESESQFRAIFDTILEVVVLLAPTGTIVQLNRKQAVWRDQNHHNAIGQKIWNAPTLKAYPQHIPLIKRAVKTAARGEHFHEEVRMEREGVPTAYLDVSMQPVRDPSGKVIYLLFEARDITDLKAAQEQLRQSQKMEALGQLTGGIAHDFNNLLTVVVGGLDVISKRVEDDKLKRYATNALAAAERGARLTGQLLAFSRVQRLEVRPTPVTELIENMRPLLRNVLGPGIEKRFKLGDRQVHVMADPTQLEVAVLNLAINARDAMPDGGVLTFESRVIEETGDTELEPGAYVELSISDTGTGMDEHVAARAFEPFFTTKDVGKGTGLGLSMVYGMARQSGGAVRLESRPGAGTTIRLLFRAAPDEADRAEPQEREAPAAPAKARPASILVIDDDPDVRAFIVESLEEQGYKVSEAADGTAGLEAAERLRPDLAIIDFIMPGLSGAEVASKLLDRRPRMPLLFVSGYSETDAVRRVAPDAQVIAKPFRADVLGNAVRGALTKS